MNQRRGDDGNDQEDEGPRRMALFARRALRRSRKDTETASLDGTTASNSRSATCRIARWPLLTADHLISGRVAGTSAPRGVCNDPRLRTRSHCALIPSILGPGSKSAVSRELSATEGPFLVQGLAQSIFSSRQKAAISIEREETLDVGAREAPAKAAPTTPATPFRSSGTDIWGKENP